MRTCLVDPDALAAPRLVLEGASFHHHVRVARLAAGDRLRVVDGEGRARWGWVRGIGRDAAEIELAGEAPSGEPVTRLDIWVAVPERTRVSWLVEKLTEIGTDSITFFRSQRGQRSLGAGTLARLERVATQAVEQCGRAWRPRLLQAGGWDDLLRALEHADAAWILDLEGEAAEAPRAAARGLLAIGPEGGWSPEESRTLRACGVPRVRLPLPTLRVETAAVVGAACWLTAATTPDAV